MNKYSKSLHYIILFTQIFIIIISMKLFVLLSLSLSLSTLFWPLLLTMVINAYTHTTNHLLLVILRILNYIFTYNRHHHCRLYTNISLISVIRISSLKAYAHKRHMLFALDFGFLDIYSLTCSTWQAINQIGT